MICWFMGGYVYRFTIIALRKSSTFSRSQTLANDQLPNCLRVNFTHEALVFRRKVQSPRTIEGQSNTELYRSPGLINSVNRGGTLDLTQSNHLPNITQVASSRGRAGKEPVVSLPLHCSLLPCSPCIFFAMSTGGPIRKFNLKIQDTQ